VCWYFFPLFPSIAQGDCSFSGTFTINGGWLCLAPFVFVLLISWARSQSQKTIDASADLELESDLQREIARTKASDWTPTWTAPMLPSSVIASIWTERRWKELQLELMNEASTTEKHHGTVGAVALDQNGNLAAGTSTGGTSNKRFGRIGDSPIIGAGTYAENESVAVSCTGTGEYFIRWTVAHDIAALYKYRGMTAEQAGNEVINHKLKDANGDGGAIILDGKGNFAMPFNTAGMYRGWIGADGVPHVLIYRD